MGRYQGYNPDWGKKATMKYIKDKQRRVDVKWRKDEFEEEIAPAIEESGLPLATFIKNAVAEKIEREGYGKKKKKTSDNE